MKLHHYLLLPALFLSPTSESASAALARPNVLFIATDDLNDWVGCLGGHPQTMTPHLDRLARSGVLFANAHCPAPACNPSRTAIFSGVPPYRSGLYNNMQKLARNRYFEHIQKEGQWKKGIQAYLASIHFADAMLGRVAGGAGDRASSRQLQRRVGNRCSVPISRLNNVQVVLRI